MQPTPLERLWATVYRSAQIATGAWLIGLVLYVSEGALLRRVAPIDLVDDVDCSVLLAERAHERGFIKRYFGW